jgi:mannose-6-phosphate isomerase-like protein (cupin superfamily)
MDASTTWFAEVAGGVATAAPRAAGCPTMVERSGRAGEMAPLHRRDEAETYRVIAGEVTFWVGGEVVQAGEGDVVVAPAGAVRTWRAESDGARWVVVTRVTAPDRFQDFGRAMSPPLAARCREWPSPSELATVASIAAPNGIELLGPPGALPDGR